MGLDDVFTFSHLFVSSIFLLFHLVLDTLSFLVCPYSACSCLWSYVALCYSSLSHSLLCPPTEQASHPGPPCPVMSSPSLLIVQYRHQASEVFVTCRAERNTNGEMHKHRKCCFLTQAAAKCLSLCSVYQKAATWALSLNAHFFLRLSPAHLASWHVPSTVINPRLLPYFQIVLH